MQIGFIYTLAVLFLLMSVAAILKLAVELYINLRNSNIARKVFKLKQNITLFVFLFNFSLCLFFSKAYFFLLVRSIYFFSLPDAAEESPVGDYILVVLPTFLL